MKQLTFYRIIDKQTGKAFYSRGLSWYDWPSRGQKNSSLRDLYWDEKGFPIGNWSQKGNFFSTKKCVKGHLSFLIRKCLLDCVRCLPNIFTNQVGFEICSKLLKRYYVEEVIVSEHTTNKIEATCFLEK